MPNSYPAEQRERVTRMAWIDSMSTARFGDGRASRRRSTRSARGRVLASCSEFTSGAVGLMSPSDGGED